MNLHHFCERNLTDCKQIAQSRQKKWALNLSNNWNCLNIWFNLHCITFVFDWYICVWQCYMIQNDYSVRCTNFDTILKRFNINVLIRFPALWHSYISLSSSIQTMYIKINWSKMKLNNEPKMTCEYSNARIFWTTDSCVGYNYADKFRYRFN